MAPCGAGAIRTRRGDPRRRRRGGPGDGGASDDGFDYFRVWLVAQGKAVYGQAIEDPDFLADLPAVRRAHARDHDLEGAEILSVAWSAHRAVTGEKPRRDPSRSGIPAWTRTGTSTRGTSCLRRTALPARGVDGLITDYPDRLRSVLADRGFTLPKQYRGPRG